MCQRIICVKGCVHYIFTSLFCISKKEDLRNKEKCFLFHFESSFCSGDNQILNFPIFKCHDVIKCLSMKHKTFYWITCEANTVWLWNLASLCNITGLTFFIIKFYGKCGLETSSRPFLIFKESSVKINLRRSACWFGLISIALLLRI